MDERVSKGLHVNVLGPFRLIVDGEAVPNEAWKSKKALRLFQYLLTRRGERVKRDTLLDLLWPNDAPEESTNKLYTTIYMLRRTLEPGLRAYKDSTYIRHSNGMYWFEDTELSSIDVDRFVSLYDESEKLEQSDAAGALALAEEALSLYRGNFLPEATYEDWASHAREHYLQLFINLTLRVSHLMVELHANYTDAVRVCRSALTRDPYREELHQAIMSHLIRAGRYAEAAAQYRQCTKMLDEEFGLPPSPDTQALFNEMTKVTTGVPSGVAEPNDHEDTGPLLCDRSTFDSIHALFLRRQERDGQPTSLIRLQLTDPPLTHVQKETVLQILRSILRQSDVLCWDGTEIFIHLQTGRRGSAIVRRRIERMLRAEDLPNAHVTVRVFESVPQLFSGPVEMLSHSKLSSSIYDEAKRA